MSIDVYKGLAEDGELRAIEHIAKGLEGKTMIHVNATAVGGGVAELLQRMVPLIESVGVKVRWEVIKGSAPFYEVTKGLHNALQGQAKPITKDQWAIWEDMNEANRKELDLDADCVFIHDPQPALLIESKKRGIWVWRCHIDVSTPEKVTWYFLKNTIERYDASIFSVARFAQSLKIPQFMIPPSIDPLSDKNRDMTDDEVDEVFTRFEIPRDKPVLLQVSRFDPFKDPLGVIDAFRMVRKYNDCRLVLAGGTADDDPEGERVLAEVMEKAAGDPEIHILLLPPFSDKEINALQRGADIVIQKSTREGFGLVVAEAMWKETPVIAGNAGGISLQVVDGTTGFLIHSAEGCALRIRQLLHNPELCKELGRAGKEHIRRNFLITGHIRNYLALWTAMENRDKKVIRV